MKNDGVERRYASAPERLALTVMSGVALASVGAGILLQWGAASALSLADTFVVALLGAAVVLFGNRSALRWCPWLFGGALLAAATAADLAFAPWLLLGAAAFGAIGWLGRERGRPWSVAPLVHLTLGAALNVTLLWAAIVNGQRPVPAAEYEALSLRAHELLADVPLHDVWKAHLAGADSGTTMLDARWLLVEGFRRNRNVAFVAAAGIRGLLGAVFGWDDASCRDTTSSFVHRLSQADRCRSIDPPGEGLFVYAFEREAMIEIINCTVHVLIVVALEPTADGQNIYWAFYVKPVGWITGFYMALIQPFRRALVYPPVIDRLEREWTTWPVSGREDGGSAIDG
jgi:hypothetical protein